MGALKNLLRKKAAGLRAWRNWRYLEKHGADLGFARAEFEGIIAADYIRFFTEALCIDCAREPVQRGFALRADGIVYWWRDSTLYALNCEDNPFRLPLSPPDVDETAIRGAAIGYSVFSPPELDRAMTRSRMVSLGRRMRPQRDDVWTPVRNAYANFTTYRHTGRGTLELFGTSEEVLTSIVFERPNRLLCEWYDSTSHYYDSGGYIFANGQTVRFFTTRDEEISEFSLAGAVRRYGPGDSDKRILCLLLGLSDDDAGLYGDYVREEGAGPHEHRYALADRMSLWLDRDEQRLTTHSNERHGIDSRRNCIVSHDSGLDLQFLDSRQMHRTHMDYDVSVDAPIPEEFWNQPVCPAWFRKRLAQRQLERMMPLYEAHVSELGWTNDEAEFGRGVDFLGTLAPGKRISVGASRVEDGIALACDGNNYWWRDRVLHAVEPDENAFELPVAPCALADAVRRELSKDADELENDRHFDSFQFRYFERDPSGESESDDVWHVVREAYRSCSTYKHVAVSELRRDFFDGKPRLTRAKETVHFERPNRVAIDWEIERPDGTLILGWLRSDGSRAKFYSSAGGGCLDFPLRGAVLRAQRGTATPVAVPAMLLEDSVLVAAGSYTGYVRENIDQNRYWLSNRRDDGDSFNASSIFEIDSSSHSILRYSETIRNLVSHSTHEVRYEPRFDAPIAPEVWKVPVEGTGS